MTEKLVNRRSNTVGQRDNRSEKSASEFDRLSEYEPKKFKNVTVAAELPLWEIIVSCSLVLCACAISGFSLYKYSQGLLKYKEIRRLLKGGWSILGRYKDGNDYEWALLHVVVRRLLTVNLIHSVSSLIVSYFAYKYRRHIWLVVGVAAYLYLFGWRFLAFVLTQLAILFFVSCSGSVVVTWITGFSFLVVMNIYHHAWMSLFKGETDFMMNFFSLSMAFLLLRYLSFIVEKARHISGSGQLDAKITFSMFDAFVYAFYVPNFYFGPVFIYKYFQLEVTKPRVEWTRNEVVNIVQKSARCIFWAMYLEFFLHFMYVHLIMQSSDLLRDQSLWGLGGMIIYVSSFYQAKYCVTYGGAGCFMMLDRILPPSNPRCILRVVYFSEYWSYIYLPIGGSRHGLPRQLLATVATFAFVACWHGLHDFVIAWTACNGAAVMVEVLAKKFVALPAVALFEDTYFGPAMTRRVHAFLTVPLYAFSINAIMLFYSSIENAWVFFDRFVLNGSPQSLATIYIILYGTILFSHEVERWEQRRIHQVKGE